MIRLSLALSSFFCCAVALVFLAASPEVWHWSLIPVVACGILIGVDAADWLTGRLDVFDPVGVVGLYGLFFFFLAPLLHLATDYWMWEAVPLPDWRAWLGWLSLLNFAGLLAYRVAQPWLTRRGPLLFQHRTFWQLEHRRFLALLVPTLGLSVVAQLAIYAAYGGISGYVSAVEKHQYAFFGMSWVIIVADAFPILALMGYVVHVNRRAKTPSWLTLLAVLALFFAAKLLFGGLRGARGNLVYPFFCALGLIHFRVRRIPRPAILCGLAFLVLFMYIYGFYKGAGRTGLDDLLHPDTREVTERRIKRPIESTLLDDLGRSGVQTCLLYHILEPRSDYRYSLGRTYLAAVLRVVPRPLIGDPPPTKRKEGTEAMRGRGSFDTYNEALASSRVYGFAGEAMLNFSPWSVPLAFAAFAFLVSRVRVAMLRCPPGDARWLLMPWLASFCLLALVVDSDNIAYYTLTTGTLPVALLVAGSRRCRAPVEAGPLPASP